MKEIEIKIWRHPPREVVRIDGQEVPHDVVLKIMYMDVPMTITLGELMGTFRYANVISPTYSIGVESGNKYILCRLCNRKSFNLNDVKHRYCGNCYRFHVDY